MARCYAPPVSTPLTELTKTQTLTLNSNRSLHQYHVPLHRHRRCTAVWGCTLEQCTGGTYCMYVCIIWYLIEFRRNTMAHFLPVICPVRILDLVARITGRTNTEYDTNPPPLSITACFQKVCQILQADTWTKHTPIQQHISQYRGLYISCRDDLQLSMEWNDEMNSRTHPSPTLLTYLTQKHSLMAHTSLP